VDSKDAILVRAADGECFGPLLGPSQTVAELRTTLDLGWGDGVYALPRWQDRAGTSDSYTDDLLGARANHETTALAASRSR
jgi:hypothetical protein